MLKKKLVAALAAATVASLGAGGVAQAAVPGDLCQVNYRAEGWSIITSSSIYYVFYPSVVRIDGYAGPDYYNAHGNGKPSGILLRVAVNQSTCQ